MLRLMINGQAKHSLAAAITTYLEKPSSLRSLRRAAYSTALTYFAESCHKHSSKISSGKTCSSSHASLRDEKGQAPRSVYNKFENVMAFLKAQGVRGLVGKNDWPRFTEEEPEVYEREDVSNS